VPLTDELKTLADFGTHFGDYVQDPTKLAATGSSKLAPAVAIGAGAEGLKSAGPIGMLAAGVPFMDKPVRALVGSDAYQNAMVNPSYQLDPTLPANLARYAGQQIAAPAATPAQDDNAPLTPEEYQRLLDIVRKQ
jgi:hypothetical protein